MNPKLQTFLLRLVFFISGGFFIGFFAFWFMIAAAFSGEQFYSFLAFYGGILLIILYGLMLFWKSKRKLFTSLFFIAIGVVCICAGVKEGLRARDESKRLVSVQDFDLKEYIPYKGAKTALLDKPSTLTVTEDFPVFDGATALYPVYAAFAQALNPDLKNENISYVKDSTFVWCNNTPYAYENIITGTADIIFVAGPSFEQVQKVKEAGLNMKLVPIGKEAFVFFVNKDNPMTGLTTQQVKDIYSGRVKNWKQIGGPNAGIRAFQRPAGSGSQTALENLMKGDIIMPAPLRDRPAGMGGIIKEVADYRNYKNSIGFSFRFFVEGMVKNDNVKMLSIDGVFPTEENIKNGTYPLTSSFYAVTTDTINPNAHKIIEWITGPQGQELVKKTGYVPIS